MVISSCNSVLPYTALMIWTQNFSYITLFSSQPLLKLLFSSIHRSHSCEPRRQSWRWWPQDGACFTWFEFSFSINPWAKQWYGDGDEVYDAPANLKQPKTTAAWLALAIVWRLFQPTVSKSASFSGWQENEEATTAATCHRRHIVGSFWNAEIWGCRV